ncbi:MAG: exodeoxyribonuclease III [Promicromonosporaceae bacterium]|nr:exodeoxyribonuclease III [Promicromonosporaceae bacterium]
MTSLTVATVNVNGVRAAFRKGMGAWLEGRAPDVVLLQEVRAPLEELAKLLPADEGWHLAAQASEIKGRAGVAIASRLPLRAVRLGLEPARDAQTPTTAAGESLAQVEPLSTTGTVSETNPFGEPPVDTGRWIEAEVSLPDGTVATVVSCYLHSATNAEGYLHTLLAKYAHLDKVTTRLAELAGAEQAVVVGGDVNIAHRNADIANWRGNKKSAGFLPEERAYLDRWFAAGWTDLGRHHAGEVEGPYPWWTWRGQAFNKDVGWRLDYLLTNHAAAAHSRSVTVDRAEDYPGRWSDHAPVVGSFDF